MRWKNWVSAALLSTLTLPALGQDTGFNTNNFKPTLDPHGYVTMEGARSLRLFQFHGKVMFNWANNPLEFQGTPEDLIDNLSIVDFVLGVGLLEFGNGGLEFGVDLPLVVENDGRSFYDGDRQLDEGDIGDLRAQLKAVLMDREDDAVGVFARGWIEFPTGETNDWTSNNDDTPTLNFGVGVEKQMGMLRAGIEVDYEWIEGRVRIGGVNVDDKVHLKAGVAIAPLEDMEDLEIMFEVHHWTRAANPWDHEVESPVELGGAIKYSGTIDFMVGGSGGLNRGVGAPDARVFASAGFTF
jgi:hypothetical protein